MIMFPNINVKKVQVNLGRDFEIFIWKLLTLMASLTASMVEVIARTPLDASSSTL